MPQGKNSKSLRKEALPGEPRDFLGRHDGAIFTEEEISELVALQQQAQSLDISDVEVSWEDLPDPW